MVFKCKMCGGDLDVEERSSVGTCQYCGTKQTLPKLDDDKRKNLYERANHHRRQNEFDKAAAIYESILNEDRSDAEAYWSLVLCKYGVEYVQDPTTGKRVPTCHRTQFGAVLADEDYKQAVALADAGQKALYEEEAAVLDGIQKGILEISNHEEPFDIFICYKETDEQGKRTLDSKLAQDLHHELTEEGFKVFFSRVTLEDKIGSAYEPYIFAALQSAKAMVVVGTKPEHFSAVWVKNEWSRYLALIKGGAKKTLIPAYRDMDPYAIPEELSHLQAQDMGKLGFMQDLIRGIKKVVGSSSAPQSAAAPAAHASAGPSVASLLQRAFLELEDGHWQKADGLLEQVLNVEPENPRAYAGKAMAQLQVRHEADLGSADTPLGENSSFQKAFRFADESYRTVLQGYLAASAEHQELLRKRAVYDGAVAASKKLESASKSSQALSAAARACRNVAAQFRSIPGFSNADQLAAEMEGRAASAEKMAAAELKRERRARRIKLSIKLAVTVSILTAIAVPVSKPVMKAMAAAKVQKIEAERKKAEAAKEAEEQKKFDAEIAEAKKKEAADKERIKKEDEANKAAEKKIREAAEKLRAEKYPAAEALFVAGKYPEAMAAFREIGGYQFGKYRWRILDVQSDRALLVTEDVVADMQYNSKDAPVTWETSTIRKYLNGEFYNQFGAAEKERILQAKVSNPASGSLGGKATKDMVFILSAAEAKDYFKDFPAEMEPKKKGIGFKTQEESARYFKANGDRIALNKDGYLSSWWLRNPVSVNSDPKAIAVSVASLVEPFRGEVQSARAPVDFKNGVRPAIWIKLK